MVADCWRSRVRAPPSRSRCVSRASARAHPLKIGGQARSVFPDEIVGTSLGPATCVLEREFSISFVRFLSSLGARRRASLTLVLFVLLFVITAVSEFLNYQLSQKMHVYAWRRRSLAIPANRMELNLNTINCVLFSERTVRVRSRARRCLRWIVLVVNNEI